MKGNKEDRIIGTDEREEEKRQKSVSWRRRGGKRQRQRDRETETVTACGTGEKKGFLVSYGKGCPQGSLQTLGKKRRKKEKLKKQIVAKALDCQRYPMPLS